MTPNPLLRQLLLPHFHDLLTTRQYPKTFCPSEVARALTADELKSAGLSSWRDAMPEIRAMAAEMRELGEVEVLQKGHVLAENLGSGLQNVVGPIRIRKTP